MELLMIGIVFVRNINPNSVSNLKSSHWSMFLLLYPVSYGWHRSAPEFRTRFTIRCQNGESMSLPRTISEQRNVNIQDCHWDIVV
jgi:hypothetical protein